MQSTHGLDDSWEGLDWMPCADGMWQIVTTWTLEVPYRGSVQTKQIPLTRIFIRFV